MKAIKKLPPEICANVRSGVTIPTPAQGVMELVLNAIDAKATSIAIRIDLRLFKIQVVDNGIGIPRSDLEAVGKRSFTSKCFSLDEYYNNLMYHGYRGEALASICELSGYVEIVTRAVEADSMETYRKLFLHGKEGSVKVSDLKRSSCGTTITVNDFMFNMPVRRSTMKEAIELEDIRSKIECIALAHPEVSLSLRNDAKGRVMLEKHKSSDLLGAFEHLFGHSISGSLCAVNYSSGKFTISGYISKESHRHNNLQFIYVNKKPVMKTKLHKLVCALLAKSSIIRCNGLWKTKPIPKGVPPERWLNYPSLDKKKKFSVFVLNVVCARNEYELCWDSKKTAVYFRDWDGILACVSESIQTFLKVENLVDDESSQEIKGNSNSIYKNSSECNNITEPAIETWNLQGAVHSLAAKRWKQRRANVQESSCREEVATLVAENNVNQFVTPQTSKSGVSNNETDIFGNKELNSVPPVVKFLGTMETPEVARLKISKGAYRLKMIEAEKKRLEIAECLEQKEESCRNKCENKTETENDYINANNDSENDEILEENAKKLEAMKHELWKQQLSKKLDVFRFQKAPKLLSLNCDLNKRKASLNAESKNISKKNGFKKTTQSKKQNNERKQKHGKFDNRLVVSRSAYSAKKYDDSISLVCAASSSSSNISSEFPQKDNLNSVSTAPLLGGHPNDKSREEMDESISLSTCDSFHSTVEEISPNVNVKRSSPLKINDRKRNVDFIVPPDIVCDRSKNNFATISENCSPQSTVGENEQDYSDKCKRSRIVAPADNVPKLDFKHFNLQVSEVTVISIPTPHIGNIVKTSPNVRYIMHSEDVFQNSSNFVESVHRRSDKSSPQCEVISFETSKQKPKLDGEVMEERNISNQNTSASFKSFFESVDNREKTSPTLKHPPKSKLSIHSTCFLDIHAVTDLIDNNFEVENKALLYNEQDKACNLPVPNLVSNSIVEDAEKNCFFETFEKSIRSVEEEKTCDLPVSNLVSNSVIGGDENSFFETFEKSIRCLKSKNVDSSPYFSLPKKLKNSVRGGNEQDSGNHITISGDKDSSYDPNFISSVASEEIKLVMPHPKRVSFLETNSPYFRKEPSAHKSSCELLFSSEPVVQEIFLNNNMPPCVSTTLKSSIVSPKRVVTDDLIQNKNNRLSDEAGEGLFQKNDTFELRNTSQPCDDAQVNLNLENVKTPLVSMGKSMSEGDNYDWTLVKNSQGKEFYIHGPSGFTSFSAPALAGKANMYSMSERMDFIPKGMSPVLNACSKDHNFKPSIQLPDELKNELDLGDENNLKSVKWRDTSTMWSNDVSVLLQAAKENCEKKVKLNSTPVPDLSFIGAKMSQLMLGETINKSIFTNIQVIGQFDNKFIVTLYSRDKKTSPHVVGMFDQHAVHERIRLEALKKEYSSYENGDLIFKTHKLDECMQLEISSKEYRIIGSFRNKFEKLGLYLVLPEEYYVQVHRIPLCVYSRFLRQKSSRQWLEKILRFLIQDVVQHIITTSGQDLTYPVVLQDIINSEACKGAIKFGDPLTTEQCEHLLLQLSTCELPFICAHGRPSFTPIFDMRMFDELDHLKYLSSV